MVRRGGNLAVTELTAEIILIALIVAFAGAVATILYMWATNSSSYLFYIHCGYDSPSRTFTVLSNPNMDIRWSDCEVTLYNQSNETTVYLHPYGDKKIEANDIIDVSNYVADGNSYIFTIISKSSSQILYYYAWTQ